MTEQPTKADQEATHQGKATMAKSSDPAKSFRVALTPLAQELVKNMAKDARSNAAAIVETAIIDLYSKHKNGSSSGQIESRLEYLIGMIEEIQATARG